MTAREYDAMVVGASFAGLTVARELRGEVLLLDAHEVGSHQTSACGTPLWVPEMFGVKESVIQVHTRAVIHTPTRTVTYDASDSPYCTFEYRRFCRGLLDQCRVRFLRTLVRGFVEGGVATDAGLRALQWAVQRVPGAWLGPLAELGDLPAIRRRWWPCYLDFGKPSTWNGGQPWAR